MNSWSTEPVLIFPGPVLIIPGTRKYHPDYWRGTYTRNGGRKKWYDHPTAHMALLMVQSERLDGLAPVDRRSLERRLAEWHQSVMPPDKRTEEVYAGTGLAREAYREWGFPPEWRLWEAGTRRVVGVDEPYPGGAADSARLNGTPARDVVEWSTDLALIAHGDIAGLFSGLLIRHWT